ncbi:MAG: transglutaminase family protein [Planctomycetota bacterium]|jgi:hypothetical protein
MLLTEAVAIGMLSGTWVLQTLCIVAALVAVFWRIRFEMTRQRVYDVIALLAVGFVVKYLLTPDNPRYQGMFESQPISFALAEFVLTLQVLQFYARRRDDRLPLAFPATGVVVLTCAAIVRIDESQREQFLLICVVFIALAALFCDSSRRFLTAASRQGVGRSLIAGIVLLVIAGLSWSSATALYRYERQLDDLVQRFLIGHARSRGTGLSETARLGSVNYQKLKSAMDVMLHIRTRGQPGYFRARAYDVFDGRQWLPLTRGNVAGTRPLAKDISPARHESDAFLLRDWSKTRSQSLKRLEVWPDTSLAGSFPTPVNPVWLQAQADILTVDSHGILRSDDAPGGLPYTVDVAPGSMPDDPWMEDADFIDALTTPPRLVNDYPAVRALAERLFADCQTVQQKIDVVVDYFVSNYSYSRGISVPRRWRHASVAWFLLEQPSAHCEYFASGAATLLRLGDVPCRYMTGFVVHEENQFNRDWIARNRDAHAWVEAWDEHRGWVVVEATPGDGIPAEPPVSETKQFREFLASRFQRLRVEFQRKGIRGLFFAVLRRLNTSVGISFLCIVVLVVLYVYRGRLLRLFRRRSVKPDRETLAFHQSLKQVDRALAGLGFERSPQQTLDAFADELRTGASEQPALNSAADWYRQYARLRYGGYDAGEAAEFLAQSAATAIQNLRSR